MPPEAHATQTAARAPAPAAEQPFRHKALAAWLAFLAGGLGLHRLYLRQSWWWIPVAVTVPMAVLLIGVRNWYQTPAFFIAMVPVLVGFVEALMLALTPDAKFDARFNRRSSRRNCSGWDAVLVAIATLAVGATVLMTTIALLFQTLLGVAA
jgi:hypothetical protein